MLSKLRRPRSRESVGSNPDGSRSIARERLYNALNRDRYDLMAPEVVEALRRDLLNVISRHLDVEDQFHELEIQRKDDSFYLVASVRVSSLPRWAAVS
ncbi:MAG: cell division topological specificity factor MinE [Chloroflexota bacterium]|nr:cell division topological specificity factor MinE [Chloroflexota bacterium]